jgi:hypothetical protein
MSNIDDKLKELRKEWLANPAKRKIIEVRAKLLKMSSPKTPATFEEAKNLFS